MGLGRSTLLVISFLFGGCQFVYPEVAVVNQTNEHIFIKNVSFNGCVWAQVIGFNEATFPGRCLPGEDRIHFQKFDVEAYCQEQTEGGTLAGTCPYGPGTNYDSMQISGDPNWFNYQTISVRRIDYGDFYLFEVTTDDMEQDFSVPGPYGH